MLNLTFAPAADLLFGLAEKKIKEAWRDPFDPPAIIVPNPAVKKWLTIQLAQSQTFGSVINGQMITLEKFLWDALKDNRAMEMLRAEHLSQVICAILGDNVIDNKIYTPIRNYLRLPNGKIDALKRVQLSMRIAAQFLEYEYNRPSVWDDNANSWKSDGLDASWMKGKTYYGGNEHEAWQMDLYRRAMFCFADKKNISLPQLYRHKRETCAREKREWCNLGSNRQIILFGVSKISHFHRNTLVEISQIPNLDMHVFLTNPCAEFWEDVDTSRRTIRRKWRHDSPKEEAGIMPVKSADYDRPELDMFANEDDHALLKLWGGAGKENIFLWCPQAHWNFEYHADDEVLYNDSAPKTLLKSIQKSLLLRKNDLEMNGDNFANDNSLQIIAAPDISREVEEVRELILDMVHEKLICNFNDVAVYMPDTNKYLPHIERVFGAYPQYHSEYIPFTVLDTSCKSSLMSKAIFALLDIISGQFNRAKIFELLRNPIVWASMEISPDDVAQWEIWADSFGMFRGYDAMSRECMGDKGEAITDEHTFKRGIEKVIAEISSAKNENAQSKNEENIFETLLSPCDDEPTDLQSDLLASAETFLQILTELNALTLSFINTEKNTINICEAVKILQDTIWSWLANIPNEDSVNCAVESYVRRETLSGFEKIFLQSELAKREEIPIDEFIALARSCVCVETAIASSAWNGVTFAPLRASMVLPHKVIFAIGLGAGDFPGVNESGSWDLLASKRNVGGEIKSNRIVGDSDRVRDNRFVFLELIHAAAERLVLSYKARDMQKDEQLQPSSVILELEEYLIRQGLTNEHHETRSSSVRRVIPWVVHESLNDTAAFGRKHGTWNRAERELSSISAKPRVRHRHELSSAVNNSSASPQNNYYENRLADIGDVKMFLQNPLEYHLYKTLEIRDDYNEFDMSAIDEPITSDFKLYRLRKKIWIELLNLILSGDIKNCELMYNAEIIADKIYSEHVDLGQAPEGYLCRMEREAFCAWAGDCAPLAWELCADFTNHRLAQDHEFSYSCGEFVINGTHKQIILPNITEDNTSQNKNSTIGVLAFKHKKQNAENNCELWTDGAITLMSEIKKGSACDVQLIQLNHGDKPDMQIQTMSMCAEKLNDMETWLRGVLSQMLFEKRCEHLPFEWILELEKNKWTIEEFYEQIRKKPYKSYKKSFMLADARTPIFDNDELREIIKSRYAPILERRLINE